MRRAMNAAKLVSVMPAHRAFAVWRYDASRSPGQHEHEPEPALAVLHDYTTLTLCVEGSARVWLEGTEHQVSPGQVLIVPEGASHHALERAGQAVGVGLCAGCMARSPWGGALSALIERAQQTGRATLTLTEAQAASFEQAASGLEAEQQDRRPNELAVHGWLSILTATLQRAERGGEAQAEEAGSASQAMLVSKALAFIAQHAHQGPSLQEVARAVHRSPSHVAALLKARTGRTAVAWITHHRMALARQLLLTTDESIEGIAQRLGFASASHFHRTFRGHHGLSPGAWRQAHHGG